MRVLDYSVVETRTAMKIFTHKSLFPRPFGGDEPHYIVLLDDKFYFYNPDGTLIPSFKANDATFHQAIEDGTWLEIEKPEGFAAPIIPKK